MNETAKNITKKAIEIISKNLSYIVWTAIFFTVSFWITSSNYLISKPKAFIICIVAYALSVSTALLFGEPILRFIYGIRPVETKEEKDRVIPLFNTALKTAKEYCPNLPEIKPYIIDSVSINAVAVGSHTVAVTKGALDVFSDEELQGIILHEIAHIHNGDTKAAILNKVGNGFFSVYIILVNLFFRVLDLLFRDLDDPDTKHTSGVLRALFEFIRIIINLSVYLILLVGTLVLSGNSRKRELEADRFAFELGYGEELKTALYLMQKLSLSGNSLKTLLSCDDNGIAYCFLFFNFNNFMTFSSKSTSPIFTFAIVSSLLPVASK